MYNLGKCLCPASQNQSDGHIEWCPVVCAYRTSALAKKSAVDPTNQLLAQHDIPPIEVPTLTDKVNDEQPPLLTEMVRREGQKSISDYLENRPLSNGQAVMRSQEALNAYQQNAGEHANAWKLLEEMGRKAAMFDDLLKDVEMARTSFRNGLPETALSILNIALLNAGVR